MMLDAHQQKSLLPLLLELEDKHNLPFHLDCALAPILMGAGVSTDSLSLFGAYGCIAGTLLLTVDLEGFVRPCSHLGLQVCRVEDLPAFWTKPEV